VVSPWKFLPCDVCCEAASCTLFEDVFGRDDSSDLGEDWTEVAGDWDIDTGRLHIDSTAAICKYNTDYPGGTVKVIGFVTIKVSDLNDQARIILDYVDSDNYVGVEITFSATCLRSMAIIGRVAGVETELVYVPVSCGQAFGNAITWGFYFCWKDGVLRCFSSTYGDASISFPYAGTSNTVALGTGAAVVGNVYFQDFRLLRDRDDCYLCRQDCDVCKNGFVPMRYQGTVADIIDDHCVGLAAFLNGPYLPPFTSQETNCVWHVHTDEGNQPVACGEIPDNPYWTHFTINTAQPIGDDYIYAILQYGHQSLTLVTIEWRKTFEGQIDCDGLVDYQLDFYSMSSAWGWFPPVDASGSTVSLTAL